MKTHLLKIGLFTLVMTVLSAGRLMAFTAVTNGDWTNGATWGGTAPSGNVSNQDIIIPSGIEVNLNTDVVFSGLLNNFTVDGSLTSTTNNQLSIQSGAFGGSGDIDIERIAFSGLLTTYTHTGDLMVNTFTNMGAPLTLAAQITVTDTLNLDGGALTVNTGGNLMLNANAVIVRNDGSLATSGGVFNSAGTYRVRYVGGNKTTGIEINSVNLQDADISLTDNTTILTMGSNMMIQGNLQLNTGILNVAANDLEIHGNIHLLSGTALTTTNASNVTIQSAAALTSGLVFTSGSSMDQFSIDFTGTGTVMLKTPLAIAGELQLHNGTLSIESGATLTMNTGSLIQVMNGKLTGNGGTFVGTASYDVEYIGSSTVTTGEEITGSGLNDVDVNIASGQVMMDDDVTVGGELNLRNGKLNLNSNDLILNGTLDQDQTSPIIGSTASDLQLNMTIAGNDTIYFDASNQNVEQLVVNVTGGNIVLGSMLHVNDELTLTSGSVVLLNDNLVMAQNADITGYNDTRYIVTTAGGRLQMSVTVSSPYMVFPVGTTTNYSPASIQVATGSDDGNFMVKAFDGVFVAGTENSGYNSAAVSSVVNRTWLIETDAAPLNMNLKLGWMAVSEVNGFDRTHSFISHYTGGDWDTQSSVNATAGANNTYEIDRTGITSLSPFTVSDEDAELIVDEETALLNINIYPNPATDVMNIDYTNTTGASYTYLITDISGRTYQIVDNGANQMDVSTLSAGIYLLRMTNTETNKTAVRQFIKK